jgi:hypothetical protein
MVPYYCIVTKVHASQSLRKAAIALTPGRVWGEGRTPTLAEDDARHKAEAIRDRTVLREVA